MMTVPMESASAQSSREHIQSHLSKNIELENGLRMDAKAKVPSDSSSWLQMRENYEAMILEDHEFSESHEIEFSLWQLHYRRIEEFRGHISSVPSLAGSNTSEGGKSVRLDRIRKILSVFKSFLSESTGFYHDLILKIRAKYGLPLGYFFEGPENQRTSAKEGKKSAEMKKGLVSCHRCLIYLGDLARYKVFYGNEGSASRDYAAASSYYLQAASLWPLGGNPHHQLAILSSYSGDEFVAVYRYFRSLAVENPFPTARDNLIIAFEKNRQIYSQLPGEVKISSTKTLKGRMNGRGRGSPVGDSTSVKGNITEIYKAFCVRFVRLNGILFTRTSIETFGAVFSLVVEDLHYLLSSGKEEELNFGSDLVENGLFIVRLVSILIFTIHNVNKESEGQSYAEILQRSVLLQNALTSAFEIMGHIMKRCNQLQEMLSSCLLPAILVFIEWLACHLDIATAVDVDKKEAFARNYFWNQCISFLNKLLSIGVVSMTDEDGDTCFSDMSRNNEEEIGKRLALWEDFELRGFLPLTPAHLILDFSRQHSNGADVGGKEKRVRAQRLLAAGKTLLNVVKVDQQGVYYEPKLNGFVIGIQQSQHSADLPFSNGITNGNLAECISNANKIQSAPQVYNDVEEEEEVIVFKPPAFEKHGMVSISTPLLTSTEVNKSVENSVNSDGPNYSEAFPASCGDSKLQFSGSSANLHQSTYFPNTSPPPQNINSNWISVEQNLFANGPRDSSIAGNGLHSNLKLREGLSVSQPLVFSLPFPALRNRNADVVPFVPGVSDPLIPSMRDSIMPYGTAAKVQAIEPPQFSFISKKNPVSRPVRHAGPPPGFSSVPSKELNDSMMGRAFKKEYPVLDDYRWLDGYQSPLSKSMDLNNCLNSVNDKLHLPSNGNSSNGAINFPFPGKHVPAVVENQKKQLDYPLLEHLKLSNELQYNHVKKEVLQLASFPDQYEGQSFWSGGFFV